MKNTVYRMFAGGQDVASVADTTKISIQKKLDNTPV
jgi:hypothetical protein